MIGKTIDKVNREFHGFAFCEKGDLIDKINACENFSVPPRTHIQRDKKTWEKEAVVFLNTGNLRGKGLVTCQVISGRVKDLKTQKIYEAPHQITLDEPSIQSLLVLEKAEILSHVVDAEPCECTAYETLARMKLTKLLMNESKEDKQLLSSVTPFLTKVAMDFGMHSEALYELVQAARYQKLVHYNIEGYASLIQNGLMSDMVERQDGLSLIEAIYGESVKALIEESMLLKRDASYLAQADLSVQILSLVTQYAERRNFGFYHSEVMTQLKRMYGESIVLNFLGDCPLNVFAI